LLSLVAPTAPDAELVELWRTHPIVAVKTFARRTSGVASSSIACSTGIVIASDPDATLP